MVAKLLQPVKESEIAIAMAFPMDDVLDRYCKEQEIPFEVAKQHERELKRFLTLCAINPDASYGMAGPVDELWHTFIVFTRDYEQFCQKVAGRFIHHVPVTEKQKKAVKTRRAKGRKDPYLRFHEDYEKVFGEKPPTEFWPSPQFLSRECASCDQKCAGDCNSCNHCNGKARASAVADCSSPSECGGSGGAGEGGCVGGGRPSCDSG